MANYQFRQQPVDERNPCSENAMNSEQAVRTETAILHLPAQAFFHFSTDELGSGCSSAQRQQVFVAGHWHSEKEMIEVFSSNGSDQSFNERM